MTAQETDAVKWLSVAQAGLLSSVITEHSNVSNANTDKKVTLEHKIRFRKKPQAFFDLCLVQPLVLMLS